MASNSILKLQVDDKQYEASLKSAQQGLQALMNALRNSGKSFSDLDKNTEQYVRALGNMEATAKSTRGRIGEMSSAFVELSQVEKQLTDQERQSPVGKALTESLNQLKQRTIEAKQELADLDKQLTSQKAPATTDSGGLFGGGKLDGMLQVFGGNVMTKGFEMATGAITSMVNETATMIKQGVELARQGEGIRIAFERLGRGDLLQGLREATHGTVTDLELMKAAVQFNDFKLPLDQLGTMLAFAQQKAKDTGQSVDYLVQSIVTGLGRKSLMILDNLGLSATEIRERMKETGDMTKAVGAIIREQMASAGEYMETAADRAAQANVSLQNKMEELGRKFAPIEEASNQLWTSMKIGILDIIGGPLATLLNQLTEAGRLKNALNDINGDGSNGAETRSGKALRILREYSGGGRGIEGKRELYDRQVASFQNQEEKEWRKANRLRDELAGLRKQQREDGTAGNLQPLIDDTTRQLEEAVNRAKAFRIARIEYEKGAKDIMKPVETNIKTDKSEQNVKKLRQQLKELEEQRKKAVKAGDQEQVEALTKQISQTKTNIGYLDPSATKGAKAVQDDFTEIIGLIGNAQERVSDLQRQIRESWDQNEITTLNQKLKDAQNELDVLQGKLPKDTVVDITVDVDTAKALQKIGDIEGVSIAPKTVEITATDKALPELVDIEGITITPKTFAITATDEALPKLREIEGITIDDKTMTVTAETADALRVLQSIEGVTIEPKSVTITATDEALPKLREIQGVTIEPKTFAITATDEALPLLYDIQGVTIDPKNVTVTADTTDALQRVQKLVAEMNGTVVEMKVVPVITDEDIERSLREQYGKPIEVPITPMTAADKLELEVRTKLSDQNIEADMQTLRTLMEAQIKNGIEGVEIPTGFLIEKIMGEGVPDEYWQKLQDQINEKLKELGIEPIKINFETGNIANVGKETEKSWRGAAGAMSAAGSALQGLEDPGAKIAGIVGQAIANIALGFAQATTAVAAGGPFAWIAAISGGLATMLSTISAIHSATGYAQGGIVDGRGGGFVGGMAYSGDNVGNVRLDSGELVLNRSQQNNLANALEGGNSNNVENRQPYVNGELIYLGINNYLKRTGRGEIVVSKR